MRCDRRGDRVTGDGIKSRVEQISEAKSDGLDSKVTYRTVGR